MWSEAVNLQANNHLHSTRGRRKPEPMLREFRCRRLKGSTRLLYMCISCAACLWFLFCASSGGQRWTSGPDRARRPDSDWSSLLRDINYLWPYLCGRRCKRCEVQKVDW
jgi:hypothetical protein